MTTKLYDVAGRVSGIFVWPIYQLSVWIDFLK